MKVYIPSYLGTSEKLIQKRLKKHNDQLKWLLSSSQVEEIIICSQEYPADAKVNDVRIRYIDSEAKGPSSARNTLLQSHYQSEDETCLFIDNDISSEIHSIDQIVDLARRVNGISRWNLLGFVPHGFGLKRSVPSLLTFKRKTVFASGLFFMQGIHDLYFDESLQSLEDVDFALRAMIERGYSFYEIEEYEFYKHTYNASVIYENRDRKTEYGKCREEIREKYGKRVKELGWTSLQNFINTYPSPKEIKIPLIEENTAKKLF